jgi:sigma-B regulation protein RsbU (phosphoserine phosphatase)
MDPSGHDAEEATTLENFLDALEHMADELAARKTEDINFKVSIRDDVPLAGILGKLVNQISIDWETHVRVENERRAQRSLELARAYEALQAKNDEIQRDLDAARRVQLQLLPSQLETSRCEEIDFAGHFESKDKVGGDIYDFFRVGLHAWAIVIADVSGHGIPPALITMFLKAAFRTHARWGLDADAICRDVNSDLCAVTGDSGLYATAFFGIVDLENGMLRYVNCGHPPVFVYRQNEDRVFRLEERGMILGALEEVSLTQSFISLERKDVLLATTDGLIEARNFQGEMYGQDRLLQSFHAACRSLGAEAATMDIVCSLIAELAVYSQASPVDDDVTIAAFRYLGRDEVGRSGIGKRH